MTLEERDLGTRDLESLLHPVSPLAELDPHKQVVIERAKGIHLWDSAGNEYIDGLAGLWCTALGYGNEEIAQVAYEQMKKLSYGHLFFERSHEGAIELAERLKAMVPGEFSKVFFGLSGSDANDTQIKLIRYFNNALGRPEKKKIISRQKAYHGGSFASASATGLPAFHKGFDLPAEGFLHVSCPHHYRFGQPGESETEFATRLAKELADLILQEGPETVAAFIAEPIMGAGGVLVPPETYFEKIQVVLREYDVLFIDDEVITGFGRTGNAFAAQTFDLHPDTMSLAKSLTSAYLPLSAVMVPESIHDALLSIGPEWGLFGHGFTYSGHPVSVAVALAVLEIYERENVFERAAKRGEYFQARLREFADHPLVGEVRGRGMIGACELVAERATGKAFPVEAGVGQACLRRLKAAGLLSRAMGDSIALCPPLVATESEIDEIFARYRRGLDATLDLVVREGLGGG